MNLSLVLVEEEITVQTRTSSYRYSVSGITWY